MRLSFGLDGFGVDLSFFEFEKGSDFGSDLRLDLVVVLSLVCVWVMVSVLGLGCVYVLVRDLIV